MNLPMLNGKGQVPTQRKRVHGNSAPSLCLPYLREPQTTNAVRSLFSQALVSYEERKASAALQPIRPSARVAVLSPAQLLECQCPLLFGTLRLPSSLHGRFARLQRLVGSVSRHSPTSCYRLLKNGIYKITRKVKTLQNLLGRCILCCSPGKLSLALGHLGKNNPQTISFH